MFWVAMSWGRAGWGAERAHGIYAHFPLFYFPAPQKVIKRNSGQECEGKSIQRIQVEVVEGELPRISA